eukprot:296311-Hanusia_phi.AAC.1
MWALSGLQAEIGMELPAELGPECQVYYIYPIVVTEVGGLPCRAAVVSTVSLSRAGTAAGTAPGRRAGSESEHGELYLIISNLIKSSLI